MRVAARHTSPTTSAGAVALVGVLLLAGCGSGGDDDLVTNPGPPLMATSAEEAGAPTVAPTPTPVPATGDDQAPAADGPTAAPAAPAVPTAPTAPTAAPAPAPSQTPGAPAAAPAPPAATSSPASASPADGAPVPSSPMAVAAGTYTYDATYAFAAALGPREDGEAVVTTAWQAPAPDGTQESVVEAAGPGPSGDTTRQVVRHHADRIDLVSQVSDGDDSGDFSFHPPHPVTYVPLGAAEGTTWAWTMTSDSGTTTVDFSGRIDRREDLAVDGQPVAATVVVATLRIDHPDLQATQELVLWLDEGRRLLLREDGEMTGTADFGGAPVAFEGSTTRLLRSPSPA